MPDSPDLTASLPLGRDSLSIPLSHANGELVASMTAARHVAFDTEQSGCEEVSRDVGSSQGVFTDDSLVREQNELGDPTYKEAESVISETHAEADGRGVKRGKGATVKYDDISAISDDEDATQIGIRVGLEICNNDTDTTLKDRTKKAHKRVLQQIEYSKLVEDRIVDLEKRLGTLESKGASVDSRVNALEGEGDGKTILGISRVSFEEYRPKIQTMGSTRPMRFPWLAHAKPDTSETPLRHLIDVVLDSTLSKDHYNQALAAEGIRYDTPDRIRINSVLLLEVLTKITGHKFQPTVYEGDGSELKSQVIIRPFKLLVIHEEPIRAYTNRLAKKFEPQSPVLENAKRSSRPRLQAPLVDGPSGHPNEGQEYAKDVKVQPMTQAETNRVAEFERLESERCLQELLVLIELLDNDLKATFVLRRQIDEGTLQSIAFSDLWHLFRPGTDIRGSEDAITALDRSSEPDVVDNVTFTISCFYYTSDGERLGTILKTFQIKSYNDPKLVTSLPVFPIHFAHGKSGSLGHADLIRRGRRFIELAGSKVHVVHKKYSGLTLNLEQLSEEVDSEVIIDMAMALLKNPSLRESFGISSLPQADRRETMEFLDPVCRREGCHENTVIHQDHEVDQILSASVLTDMSSDWDPSEGRKGMQDSDYILCPNKLYGYVLRSRKWVTLDVKLVQDIKEHSGGFDSLVLPRGHKDTLLALVETHSRGRKPDTGHKLTERQIDLVRGKGKGLIILLHGEPGVGKTSTAECVAEHTSRPLFQVTCGDIGESAEKVERTLENHFQLAHKWGCVLLLDEADVFLMRRTKNDLKRNAIVSVFLRVLEYYSGILFLTTNRVGVFDQAFRSRIHMSFFYPKLGQKATLEIWKMNLDRTQKYWGDSIKLTPKDYDKILAYADEHYKELEPLKTTWNGRQIRNAFQTAIALAEYDAHKAQIQYDLAECPKPTLKVDQFEKVAEASKHFDEYLKQTAGLDSDIARQAGERMDELDEEKIKEEITEQTRQAQRM